MESSDTIETPAHREQTTDSTEEEALAGVQVSDTTTSDGDERSRLLLGSPQRGDESLPDRGFNQDPGPSVERHQDWEGSEGEGIAGVEEKWGGELVQLKLFHFLPDNFSTPWPVCSLSHTKLV